jgi:hypothetical protein
MICYLRSCRPKCSCREIHSHSWLQQMLLLLLMLMMLLLLL